MVNISNEEIGYAAGLFDGEGCVQIRRLKQTKGGQPGYCVIAHIAMTDIQPLKFMQKHFGGTLGFYDKRKLDNRKPVALWCLYGDKAISFLRVVLPWLIVKKSRVENAIEFQKLVRPPNNRRHHLTPQEIDERDILYWRMRKMNKRGVA